MIRAREKHKTSAREMNNRACLKTPPSSCVDAPYRLAALGQIFMPAGGWGHSSRRSLVARRMSCIGQGMQHCSGEAFQPEGDALILRSCQCCGMFEGVMDNTFLLSKMTAFILYFILVHKEDLITGWAVNWELSLLYLHKTNWIKSLVFLVLRKVRFHKFENCLVWMEEFKQKVWMVLVS